MAEPEVTKEDLNRVYDMIEKLRDTIDKVRNRPPVWVTFVFTLMAGAIGWLLRYGVK